MSKGAGAEEISAAYRKLARTHHPDKVANLEPEVREYSEQRMKEINAAYAELKRQWNDQATEGARAGVKGPCITKDNHAVWSMKRRFAILSMAACVALSGVVAVSGCGVRMGMEKVDDAKQAKKQVEKQRDKLEKELRKGQKS